MTRRMLVSFAVALLLHTTSLAAQMVPLVRKGPSRVDKTNKVFDERSRSTCLDQGKLQALDHSQVQVFSNGTTQAATQLFRLCLGEVDPLARQLPLFLYAGATGQPVGASRSVGSAVATMLDPVGGAVSLQVADAYSLPMGMRPFKSSEYTSLRWIFHAGGKYLMVSDSAKTQDLPFAAAYGDIGLRFQTAAVDLSNPDSVGVFWLQGTYSAAVTGRHTMRDVLGSDAPSTLGAWNIDAGLRVTGSVNVRFTYSHLDRRADGAPRDYFKAGLDLTPKGK